MAKAPKPLMWGAQVFSLVRETIWSAVAPGLQRVGHDLATKQQGTKISRATAKTQCSQINKYTTIFKKNNCFCL